MNIGNKKQKLDEKLIGTLKRVSENLDKEMRKRGINEQTIKHCYTKGFEP